MGDILEDAKLIVEGSVREWDMKTIGEMLGDNDYSFVFIVAKPGPDGGTIVQQFSNLGAQGIFWMLNVSAQSVLNGEDGPNA